MLDRFGPLARLSILVGLYLAGAAIALRMIHAPNEVALFWPSSGLAFAVVIHYGLRWWLYVVLSNVLMHLLLDPVSLSFLPFSALSNSLGILAGAWLVRHRGRGPYLSVAFGLSVLEGGLLMAAISGIIGALGMQVGGLAEWSDLPVDITRWALGDVLSIAALTPMVLMLLAPRSERIDRPRDNDYAGRHERVVWLGLLAVALLAISTGAQTGSPFMLGLTAVPLALLLWAAMRFPPIWTAVGAAVVVFLLTTATALGIAGFSQPRTPLEVSIVLGFLSLIAVAPLLLVTGTHERRMAQKTLLRRAMTDPLTGLPNRTAFEDQLRHELERIDPQTESALVYFDLDHFKLVNDTASHQAGDALIKGVASLLRARLPVSDALFRLGGDEFAALLRDCDEHSVRARVQDALSTIDSYRQAWHGLVLNTTASAGIAMFGPQGGGYSSLLAQADAACFTAKEMGGNRLCMASTGPGEMRERTEAMRWAIRIRTGLDERQFELFCQDIVPSALTARGGRHFEILLRLNPGGRLLMPGDFIPAAERFRLGVQLDRHVVAMVLDWFDLHPDALASIDTCAINLTASSLVDEGFAQFVQSHLQASRMAPEKLCFEITETSAVHDLSRASAFIRQMRALGCRFALDDFGTGFSSFSYLRSLDVDYIKIDGSFVRDLEASPLSGAVVRSITDIAHVLNKRTVAEHAETLPVCSALRMLGVDYLQGHALHMPEPIAQYFAYEARPARVEPAH
jgi:diguanylate cyclase (GGDEF)-like protein